MNPKSRQRSADTSWEFGQSNHPLVVERRLTRLEMTTDDHEERLTKMEDLKSWLGEWKHFLAAALLLLLGLGGRLSAEQIAEFLAAILH